MDDYHKLSRRDLERAVDGMSNAIIDERSEIRMCLADIGNEIVRGSQVETMTKVAALATALNEPGPFAREKYDAAVEVERGQRELFAAAQQESAEPAAEIAG